MKLRILSDLHLEFAPLDLDPAGEDVLILAGDIALNTDAITWALRQANRLGVPAIVVAGNHEFYRVGTHCYHTLPSTLEAMRDAAADTGGRVSFLENDSVRIGDVQLLGATLWTDYELYGNGPLAMAAAVANLNDYERIFATEHRLAVPLDLLRRFSESHLWLTRHLRADTGLKRIVITHHAPSECSVHPRYRDFPSNAAFVSRLDDLIRKSVNLPLWVHGHVHDSFDYRIGDTRIVCNPRGYPRLTRRQFENDTFNPNLVIEV